MSMSEERLNTIRIGLVGSGFVAIRQKCAILWIVYAEEKSHGKIFLMDM